ncbi:Pvc16 family protein [Streptomyces sp. NPDC058326]|uniref:Pvc16 family protein n=1 Tax=Streptomyces sp. NPDC058326 TaxID=3346447 RepID=UPI0036E0BFDB
MIEHVTRALKDLLENHAGFPPGWVEMSSLEGKSTLGEHKLHLCLYAVEPHSHVRNSPPVSTAAGYEPPPLGLVLQYVMTYVGDRLEAQKRLARVAQVFHSTPRLGPPELGAELRPAVRHLAVRLNSPGYEERTGLWNAYGREYRLALYYSVEVLSLPPLQPEITGRINGHRVEFGTVRA